MTVSIPRSQPSHTAARQHSALPWELSPQGYIIPTHKSPMAMLKLKSPWVEGAWNDDPEAAANAAFIVDCVNSHAYLKARTEELEAALREIEDLGADGATAARLSNIARAALPSSTPAVTG